MTTQAAMPIGNPRCLDCGADWSSWLVAPIRTRAPHMPGCPAIPANSERITAASAELTEETIESLATEAERGYEAPSLAEPEPEPEWCSDCSARVGVLTPHKPGCKSAPIDPREKKLPAWAQATINALRHRAVVAERDGDEARRAAEEARLATSPDSALVTMDNLDNEIGLPNNAVITFKDPRLPQSTERRITVSRLKDGRLQVDSGGSALVVAPKVSNAIDVWVGVAARLQDGSAP